MDADLKRFEQELERLSPESLPEGLISRMEAAMQNWEGVAIAGDNKVVPFPEPGEEKSSPERGRAGVWAAAAAVAVLGAATGLLFTGGPKDPSGGVAGREDGASERVVRTDFLPQATKRQIVNATDGGIISNGAQPVRLMRYDFIDRVEFRNENGHEFHVERPAVRYLLVPLATD